MYRTTMLLFKITYDFKFNLFVIFFIFNISDVVGRSLDEPHDVPENVINDLYEKYKEAFQDDTSMSSMRRMFSNNNEYQVHVQKLKEVNGYKRHNLQIKMSLRNKSPQLIYINNPVESKVPNAFLTLEEFKMALMNRALVSTRKASNLRSKDFNPIVKNKTTKRLVDKIKSVPKITIKVVKKVTDKNTNRPTFKNKLKISVSEIKLHKNYSDSVTFVTNSNTPKPDQKSLMTIQQENTPTLPSFNITSDVKASVRTKTSENTPRTFTNSEILQKSKSTIDETTVDNVVKANETTELQKTGEELVRDNKISETTVAADNLTLISEYADQDSSSSSEETTVKLTTRPTTVSIPLTRATLGRPLVFMGHRRYNN